MLVKTIQVPESVVEEHPKIEIYDTGDRLLVAFNQGGYDCIVLDLRKLMSFIAETPELRDLLDV